MRFLLLNLPTPLLLLLIVGGSILITVLVTHYVRTHIDENAHFTNNEVAGFIFAAVGVVYGVLLAFMVLVVWQEYEDSQQVVEQEANTLVNLYRLGQELPEPFGAQMRNLTTTYAEQVINEEWVTMAVGQESTDVRDTLDDLWATHRDLHLAKAETDTHDTQLFQSLENLGSERRIRLLDSRLELPTLMWILLIGGGIVTLGFTLFLRAPNYSAHLLMAGMFAGLVAFVLVLVIELDNPFNGTISIQPLAFQQALQTFQRLKGN